MSKANAQENATSGATLGRLTALWALSEAALGGALHALRLPVAGILVGGSAVLLITMIAHVARQRGQSQASAILRATAVVLAVKAAASPHSPPGAYVAVSFQGALGAALFSAWPGRGLRGPALALGGAALAEAALQKLLMLFFFFGVPLVEAVDALGQRVIAMLGAVPAASFSLSLWLAVGYAGTHLAAGLTIGAFAGRLPVHAKSEQRRLRAKRGRLEGLDAVAQPLEHQQQRSWKRRWGWGALLAAVALAYTFIGEAGGGPAGRALYVALRALGALALWQVLLRPLLTAGARRFFPQSRYAAEVQHAKKQFPRLRRLAAASWREARKHESRTGRRVARFAAVLLTHVLLRPEATDAPPDAARSSPPAEARR